MKTKNIPNKLRWVIYAISFILAIVATYYMLPQSEKAGKTYEEGKPWNYGLLTAPMDFAIYKTDEELKIEQDTALTGLEPYFVIDKDVETRQLETIKSELSLKMGSREGQFLMEKLKDVYSVGVLSLKEGQELKKTRIKRVVVLDKNVVVDRVDRDELFTPKTAYEYILKAAETSLWINEDALMSYGIDAFIESNLIKDEDKTQQAKEEILKQINTTSGMVQKGEKIIDRGEVISHRTYKILLSLEKIEHRNIEGDKIDNVLKTTGSVIIIVLLYLMLFIYLKLFREKILETIRATEFIVMMVLLMLVTLWFGQTYLGVSEYMIPLVILPLVIRVFFDSRTAFFVHVIMVLLAAQMVQDQVLFILMQLFAGTVAVSSLKNMNARAQLVKSAVFVFIAYSVTFISFNLSIGEDITVNIWKKLVVFAINSALLLFAYGLIFIIEKIFGFLSDVTLVELSNVNSPLLTEFSEKCPGTFQHVLQVSNLSVEVANKINANSSLVRTGALYHDIGKMENPMYFTENQTGVNPLSELPYEEAAQIVISHVASGVKIANKRGLPFQIIEFISMHHGTSKAKYFYNSFKNKYPDKEIDESKFTYPGPLPSTKETTILMMADSVEAASRSLTSYSDESIDKLVEGVINSQIEDGQFKESPISFKDIETAKSVFKEKLKSIYHTRIKYPELNEKKEDESGIGSLLNFRSKLNGVRKPYRFQKK